MAVSITLLVLSAVVFPLISAVAVNSVTWDAYPDWRKQNEVSGYVEISSFQGTEPMACIVGETNTHYDINATVNGIGCITSPWRICNLQIPLLLYWDSFCLQ